MLTWLACVLLLPCGAWCREPPLQAGRVVLPWGDELCCDVPADRLAAGEDTMAPGAGATHGSESAGPHQCSYRGWESTSQLRVSSEPRKGVCLDVLCRIDEGWGSLVCDLRSRAPLAEPLVVRLHRLRRRSEEARGAVGDAEAENPVVCAAQHSVTCSVALGDSESFVAVVAVAVSNATAPPVRLSAPPRPAKPSPPVNLSHSQTLEGQLVLGWTDCLSASYEVRHTFNSTHPVWQVLNVSGEPRVSLDLRSRLNYTVQARCSGSARPPLWSDWSQPHHIYLDTVSYIPEKVVAKPGENVTVYCVFNDRSTNASAATWMLNFNELPHDQYRPVNQWVSQVTVRPSQKRMYDLLQCTQEWNIPYSQIFVEGAAIEIKCETNGDIDAMTCSWKNNQLTRLNFSFRWADLLCDVMEGRERAGVALGEPGQATCRSGKLGQRTRSCTIQPLRMSCYKLWLEVNSPLGPVRSRPVYVTPTDHVKPHMPSNVRAMSLSSGVLAVTWEPPFLPVEGLQCQFRYHSAVRAQPEWKVQSLTRLSRAEVAVPDMCRVYVVQVRCIHTNGTGYWSDWSDAVYSTPQNSRAPENGPDFWRVLQDDPYRNLTNVTLLFKPLPIASQSYCVDGFVVQHQAPGGLVFSEEIEAGAAYSFEWNQELRTVTVQAYNALGSSAKNTKMTLQRQTNRPCVRLFHVTVINSTCVSLYWSLLDNSSTPLAMVVQWSAHRQQDQDRHSSQSGETWARLPYTQHTQYLRGDFFDSEMYGFSLYPVFADAEGEPVYTIATRGDPAAYMLLMIITFLSVVLLVTLVLSQNQMKRFVWKDVPNPNNCSWAKGLDFKKADAIDHLFRLPEGLPAWPLLPPAETVSKVVIVDKTDVPTLTTAVVQIPSISFALDPAYDLSPPPGSASGLSALQAAGAGSVDSSAQSSVAYATVLHADPKQDRLPVCLSYKEGGGGGGGGGSSSSDEGNFSANNSDISGSFPGGLWELESCRDGVADDPRRSRSFNSVEEGFSETSEQEEEDEGVRGEKDLFYLGMDYPAEEGESEGEDKEGERGGMDIALLTSVVSDCSVEPDVLLRTEDGPKNPDEQASGSRGGFRPLYLPQFKTVACIRRLKTETQESLSPTVSYGTA